jgi:hypothetical protein
MHLNINVYQVKKFDKNEKDLKLETYVGVCIGL